jgi:hypothetical protein
MGDPSRPRRPARPRRRSTPSPTRPNVALSSRGRKFGTRDAPVAHLDDQHRRPRVRGAVERYRARPHRRLLHRQRVRARARPTGRDRARTTRSSPVGEYAASCVGRERDLRGRGRPLRDTESSMHPPQLRRRPALRRPRGPRPPHPRRRRRHRPRDGPRELHLAGRCERDRPRAPSTTRPPLRRSSSTSPVPSGCRCETLALDLGRLPGANPARSPTTEGTRRPPQRHAPCAVARWASPTVDGHAARRLGRRMAASAAAAR